MIAAGYKNRNKLLDMMRGIAITSVVMGHCTKWTFIEEFVNQYHLAIFYFVAGYFFSIDGISPKKYLWKKTKSLYLPFVLSGLVFLLLHNLLADLYVYPTYIDLNYIWHEFITLTFRLYSNDYLMGAMWFCVSLWMVSFVALGQVLLSGGGKSQLFAIVSSTVIIASLLLHIFHIKSPYCIWQNMIVTGIFFAGFFFHNIEDKLKEMSKKTCLIISFLCFCIVLTMTCWGISARLQGAAIAKETTFQIYSIAAIGCLMVYLFAMVVEHNCIGKLFSYVGKHSFSVMLLNYLSFQVVNYIYCIYYHIPLSTIANHAIMGYNSFGWFLLYTILGTAIPVFSSICYRNIKNRIEELWTSSFA